MEAGVVQPVADKHTETGSDARVQPHPQAAVLAARVLWLVRLRWFYAAALVAVGAILAWHSAEGQAWRAALTLGAAGAMSAYNVVIGLYLRAYLRRRQSQPEPDFRVSINLQAALDILLLNVVMFAGGASAAPLVAVLVLHVAVAATLLSRGDAFAQAGLAAVLCLGANLPSVVGRPSSWPYPACSWLVLAGALFLMVHFTDAILARLRRINQRLVAANARLSALDLVKSRFLRVSSHQLRGPLAAVYSMLSAIQEVGGFNPKQYELICRIRSRAQEMMTQLDEMMLLSTIKESAAETTRCGPVDVSEVLAGASAAFAEEARHKSVELTVDPGGAATVSAWEDALETVLEHLLSNAIKYTPGGGRVSVSATRKGRFVEITVADSGIGIPQEQQGQVFREFFRATNAQQVGGGTGLGLSIVKAIVERLGGSIALSSREGGGTTVVVSLPVSADGRGSRDPCAHDAPARASAREHEGETGGTGAQQRRPSAQEAFLKAA